MQSIVEFWNKMPTTGPTFIHPDDEAFIAQKDPRFLPRAPENFASFIRDPSFGKTDPRFHFSLFPSPYGGDLVRAKIFILLLNPGFAPIDYWAEQPEFRVRQKKIGDLRQAHQGQAFPNYVFDPEFIWTGAFQWWERKFRSVAQVLAKQKYDGSYLAALQDLSRNVASIEMIPYHSQSFGAGKLLKGLPSAIAARDYVQNELAPRARDKEVAIVVTRRVRDWGLEGVDHHVVNYDKGLARSASLGAGTTGGKAILKILGVDPDEAQK
ncbi:MAG: hypothetical protein AAGA94_00420 [Pseudomonadota bacterium]